MESIAGHSTAYPDMPRSHSDSSAESYLMIHRYLPVAAFYFFLNRAGLPLGLFYTTLFSPLLFVWLYLKGRRWLTAKFLLVLSPFIVAQMADGVASPIQYLRSLLLMWTVYVAVYAFCWALMNSKNVDRLLEQLILLNFCVAIFAVAILPTPLQSLLWSDSSQVLASSSHLLRLNLLSTTEPWAYGELMLPLLLFAAFRLIQNSGTRNVAYFAMIVFPFLLCQSFGGIAIGVAGISVLILSDFKRLFSRAKSWIVIVLLALLASLLVLIPNPISSRILQVAAGNDGSANLRAFVGYIGAYTAASSKSLWWGVGLGQIKFIDFSSVGYGIDNTLPNAVALTFAELGLIGVVVRFALEMYFFVKTRVYRSPFRLAMFVMAFISQLTGSYIDDVQSYLLWLFAFYPFFENNDLREAANPEVPIPL